MLSPMSSEKSPSLMSGPLVPVALVVIALAVVITLSVSPQQEQEIAPGDAPNEIWRCRACARAPGKGWMPCKVVTGRGNELGAKQRAKQRICEETGVGLDQCRLTSLDCEQLEESDLPEDQRQPTSD